jgi:2-polyprenyl-3-methyl-5-hydroxy-6-metoxy-1,4-benzoquinol methylase
MPTSDLGPNLEKVVEHIAGKSVFQQKAVYRLLDSGDPEYLEFAELVVDRLNRALSNNGGVHAYLADCYLNYTKAIRVEEMYFAKENKYRQSDFQEVYKEVYGNDDCMAGYVAGLGMTQIFWLNHYAIFRFFLDQFIPLIQGGQTGAEIGVGHGLFHSELLRLTPGLRTTLLDISPVSLNTTVKMVAAAGVDPGRTTPILCDVQENLPLEDGSLDVLLMGELIEHIQKGREVMTNLGPKMRPGGLCFFSTAANAPAQDHILLFRNTGEIRAFIADCGWKILKEQTGTINNMSLTKAESEGHNINDVAVLTRK